MFYRLGKIQKNLREVAPPAPGGGGGGGGGGPPPPSPPPPPPPHPLYVRALIR